MKLLHIPVLLCSCIRPALYNIEKGLRFVQDQAGHGTNSHLCQERTTRLANGRYRLWMRKISNRYFYGHRIEHPFV